MKELQEIKCIFNKKRALLNLSKNLLSDNQWQNTLDKI